MLFRYLCASTALDLHRYAGIDDFRESERYARAESIPLQARNFSAVRASPSLPSCRLSLVRTFPRIINGYELSGRAIIVIPMDEVSSTRLNGGAIGQSLLLVQGKANCTILEPESRLVAILSTDAAMLDRGALQPLNGSVPLRTSAAELARLQALIRSLLKFAASEPAAIAAADVLQRAEDTLLAVFDQILLSAQEHDSGGGTSLHRYKRIVDRVDELVGLDPIDLSNERLADTIGVSVRTLHSASVSVVGMSLHSYLRLKRLSQVRLQLAAGATSVKAAALANGFWHLGDFSRVYRSTFGEKPSQTLARTKQRAILSGHAPRRG